MDNQHDTQLGGCEHPAVRACTCTRDNIQDASLWRRVRAYCVRARKQGSLLLHQTSPVQNRLPPLLTRAQAAHEQQQHVLPCLQPETNLPQAAASMSFLRHHVRQHSLRVRRGRAVDASGASGGLGASASGVRAGVAAHGPPPRSPASA